MSVADIDLQAHAQGRVAGLLARSTRFRAVVAAFVAGFESVLGAFRSIDQMLDIDTQSGVVLDIIGRLVGQPRRLLSAEPRSFFGFKYEFGGFEYPLPMGERGEDMGGPMWDLGDALGASAEMDDPTYRRALKARIRRNSMRFDDGISFAEKFYAVLYELIPRAWDGAAWPSAWRAFPISLRYSGMTIEIGIGSPLTPQEKALLLYADLLPIPAGMGWSVTMWDVTANVFGFNDTACANVVGFGELGEPTWGGVFSERI